MSSSTPVPDVTDGIEYWATQPASYDGVLGGYGTGTLPRIDSLGSRLFLLHLYPELSIVPSSIRPLEPKLPLRIRALDVGAGVGRVTSDVLLHLVSDVVLLEPVGHFVQEAFAKARISQSTDALQRGQRPWKGIADQTKSVTILQGTLQEFDPMKPHHVTFLDRVGYQPPRALDDINMGFDIIWCQWCLGHLSDLDLVAFLRRSHAALREKEKGRSLIVVKENLCQDNDDGSPCTVFDEQDSSLTRSDRAWKDIFDQASLRLVMEQVQEGLPEGLYIVKMYGLR
ncbi:alpha-N-methyltransferase NTM1 [Lyophyllum atratum]|nr:alpha-N-methyltransferase NTM1 [Lyophyllum atratum]